MKEKDYSGIESMKRESITQSTMGLTFFSVANRFPCQLFSHITVTTFGG
jgi:hypothetical protein